MPFNYAKAIIQETLDSAFTKNASTKAKRIALANRLCSKISVGSQDAVLMVWACDYAANWSAA